MKSSINLSRTSFNKKLLIKRVAINNQKGNVLLFMIFIIVVMSALSAALTKISWSQADQTTKEISGLRSILMTNSAIEVTLANLYPPLNPDIVLDSISSGYSVADCTSNVIDTNVRAFQFDVNGCALDTVDENNVAFNVCTPVNISAVVGAINGVGGTTEARTQFHLVTKVTCNVDTEFMSIRKSEMWTRGMFDTMNN